MRMLLIAFMFLLPSIALGQQYTRKVINGDITHVSTAVANSNVRATFLAEQAAVRSLSSECGFPHRDIRIFKRHVEKIGSTSDYKATATAGIEFETCDKAKRVANNPEKVRALSNPILVKDQRLYEQYLSELLTDVPPKTLTPGEPEVAVEDDGSCLTLEDDDIGDAVPCLEEEPSK